MRNSDPQKLDSDNSKSKPADDHLNYLSQAVWWQFASRYHSSRKATVATLFRCCVNEMEKRNEKRSMKELPPIIAPSRSQFDRFIRDLDRFNAITAKHGLSVALAQFRASTNKTSN
jgi:hypothetical protein